MKKVLLIIGIICIVFCIIFLLLAILNMTGYYHVLDGSAELYKKLHRHMIAFFSAGAVFAAAGVLCFVIRSKI